MNHYGEPGPHDSRLDFSWYEYPFERFEEVITEFNEASVQCLVGLLVCWFERLF